jgi:hypothetical protein
LHWQIATNAKIGFKLQVTGIPGFHSLYDCGYLTVSLFSGESEDPADDTVMEQQGADAFYSAVDSLMHTIRTEDEEAQPDAAQWMNQIAQPWMIKRWSESKIANGKPLVQIAKANAHLMDLEWTEDTQAQLEALVERFSSCSSSGAWRVHQWWLACSSLVLGDTEDCNDVSGQWYDEWALDCWVDSLIFRWLTETFLPMLVREPALYPEYEEDNPLREVLLPEQQRHENVLSRAPSPQYPVQFCPLPGQVRHLKWWLRKYFADHVDMFHM